ncbi:MAG: carboxylating nicotinate-nucleotide diphosphorylase [Spirochaetales bacterium]|nr:carboxylating nicotinate-nucleotide diphosphorylase [Spirochaetales bacterium]
MTPRMNKEIKELIALALHEDFGQGGDITSEAVFSNESVRAVLLSKDTGVLAGAEIFSAVFETLDPEIRVAFLVADGEEISPMKEVAVIEGKARPILGGERTALNFIRFLSGIATQTRRYVIEARKYGRTLILDTRKTLPGFRALSKYAVRMGGGQNHRLGLFDMALVKDNHSDAAGTLRKAVERVRLKWGTKYRIEAECRNADEVRQAIEAGVDTIMLDNMGIEPLREALHLIRGLIPVEISGRVTFPDLRELVPLGADFISVGALTHSVESFDFSLEMSVL